MVQSMAEKRRMMIRMLVGESSLFLRRPISPELDKDGLLTIEFSSGVILKGTVEEMKLLCTNIMKAIGE